MANPIVQQINAELVSLQKELEQFKSTVEYLTNAKKIVEQSIHKIDSSNAKLKESSNELSGTFETIVSLNKSLGLFMDKIDSIDFPVRLDSLENGYAELLDIIGTLKKEIDNSVKNLDEQIDKIDFNKKFAEIQGVVSRAVGSNDKVVQGIRDLNIPTKIDEFQKEINKNLDSSFKELQENTKQIASDTAKSVLDLNLPVRMDKLDVNISGILSAIQNAQGRIESVERNISDKLKEANDKQIATITNLQDKVDQSFSKIQIEMAAIAKKQQTNTYITWAIIILSAILISIV